MGKWKYRKLEGRTERGVCLECGKNPQKKSGLFYATICSSCDKRKYDKNRNNRLDRRRRPYTKYKGLVCESCNFVPIHSCQLDVDHIDGNHKNNDPSNLQTLCANCHRLKTYLGQEWNPRLTTGVLFGLV